MVSNKWAAEAAVFKRRLDEVRLRAAVPWPWYPYDSLANVYHILDLLGADGGQRVSEFAAGTPVLDIGCGDGELSFFLEDVGFEVVAIDNPVTNHNGMRGIAFLARELGSNISIHSIDLDDHFRLPEGRFGLVCCFGVLYHLKNPYYLLERLARCCDYMLLSTRILSRLPYSDSSMVQQPIAYLLTADELNNDNSNYWLLTEECVKRLAERAYWRAMSTLRKAPSLCGIPVDTSDERLFMLLKSEYGVAAHVLLYGWHAPENEGWRWTERSFGVRFIPSAVHIGDLYKLVLNLYIPEQLFVHTKTLVIEAFNNDQSLGREVYSGSGESKFLRPLPRLTALDGWEIHFVLNCAIESDAIDARERGVIVSSCALERML